MLLFLLSLFLFFVTITILNVIVIIIVNGGGGMHAHVTFVLCFVSCLTTLLICDHHQQIYYQVDLGIHLKLLLLLSFFSILHKKYYNKTPFFSFASNGHSIFFKIITQLKRYNQGGVLYIFDLSPKISVLCK